MLPFDKRKDSNVDRFTQPNDLLTHLNRIQPFIMKDVQGQTKDAPSNTKYKDTYKKIHSKVKQMVRIQSTITFLKDCLSNDLIPRTFQDKRSLRSLKSSHLQHW